MILWYQSARSFVKLMWEGKIQAALKMGVRKIAPEENCPPVRVRVWFSISAKIRAEGQFSQNLLLYTAKKQLNKPEQYFQIYNQY